MGILPAELIKKTRSGLPLNESEISALIAGFTQGEIPDYQMSAWLMAVYFKGLTDPETARLTAAMRDSGQRANFKDTGRPRVDKYSTGGIGDKTSLILAPLAAACGVQVPMIAGRGLGHTGGTLDKLESIPGFRIGLSLQEFESMVRKYGFAVMGQTEDLCPADRKMYALRDVTATVESLPLICASIMSKKLAEDLTGLVLDVKWGSGAFMKTTQEASALAQALSRLGAMNGVKVNALVTSMNEPLGAFVGNSLEVRECIEIMKGLSRDHGDGDLYEDIRELTIHLGAHMLVLADRSKNLSAARSAVKEALSSGAALDKFYEMCRFQGPADPGQLPRAKERLDLIAESDGFIGQINGERVGVAAITLGAGRRTAIDTLDFSAGIEFRKKVGHPVRRGETLAILFGNQAAKLKEASVILTGAIQIGDLAPPAIPLIHETIEARP